MNEPIQAGDLCEVIDGMNGPESDNIGLVVTVLQFMGEHSKYGRMWRCHAEYGVAGQEADNVPSDQLDFAQPWLKKLPKPGVPPASKVISTDKELEKA